MVPKHRAAFALEGSSQSIKPISGCGAGIILLVAVALPGRARANSGGIPDQYGPSNTCMNCHLPGSMMKGTINLLSPVYSGQTYTFSYDCAGPSGAGPLPVAGINVHASCGQLALHSSEPKTKFVSGQIIHSQPKATTNNAVTWQFTWTAPAAETGCAFNVTGLLGNDDGNKGGNDVTCMAMKGLLVLNTPDGGPPPDAAIPKDAPASSDSGTGVNELGQGGDLQGIREGGSGSVGSLKNGDAGTQAGKDDGCGCTLAAARRGRAGHVLMIVLLMIGLLRRRRLP